MVSTELLQAVQAESPKKESPAKWMFAGMQSALSLEPLVDMPWWDDMGRSLTREKVASVSKRYRRMWDKISRKFSRQGKPFKNIGIEFCPYRGNRVTGLITPINATFLDEYLSLEHPMARFADNVVGSNIINGWRAQVRDQQNEDPSHVYHLYAKTWIDRDIWKSLRDRSWLLLNVASIRKNSSHGADDVVSYMDIVRMRPDELHILCDLTRISRAVINSVDSGRPQEIPGGIKKFLPSALREYDSGIPEHILEEEMLRRYIGQDRYAEWQNYLWVSLHKFD